MISQETDVFGCSHTVIWFLCDANVPLIGYR